MYSSITELTLDFCWKVSHEAFGDYPNKVADPWIEYHYSYSNRDLPARITIISITEPKKETVDLVIKGITKRLFKHTHKLKTRITKEDFVQILKDTADYLSMKTGNKRICFISEGSWNVSIKV